MIVGRSLLAVSFVSMTSLAALVGPALADDKPKPAPSTPPAAASAAKPTSATPAKRTDPENKKGISPYIEAVAKGEALLAARSIDGAVSAFREAIALDASKALAFYRLGEALREAGKLDDALATLETAQGKAGTDATKAHCLFVSAEIRERQKNWDAAKAAWTKYAEAVAGKEFGFATTAKDRLERLATREKLEKEYAAVKSRIEQRLAEREKEARENAMKDTKNK